MDGKEALWNYEKLLGEPSGSLWLDTKSIYYFIDQGFSMVAEKIGNLHAEQSITTVADQVRYNLDAQYLGLHLRNSNGDYFIKYNNGTTDSFPYFESFTNIIYDNNTTSVTVPDKFSISDKLSLFSQVTGTTTSVGTVAAGVSTLADTTATFITSGVQPRDVVHNTTLATDGYVLEVTSETSLEVALFDTASNSASGGWGSGDTYVIQPQGRKQLILNPPPSTASHTVTVYQIVKPTPMFGSYRISGLPEQYSMAALYFACSIAKRRDQDFKKSNDFFALANNELANIKESSDTQYHKGRTMRINMKKTRRG